MRILILLLLILTPVPALFGQVEIETKQRLYCTFEECGANGFDQADDTDAIREAVETGLPLFGQEGASYILREKVTVAGDFYLHSSGGPFTIRCEGNTNLLEVRGQESAAGECAITGGADYFLLPGHNLKGGDLVKIESTAARDWPYDDTPSRDYRKGGIYTVRRTAADSVYLRTVLYRDIPNAKIFKIDPVSVNMNNVRIEYTEKRGSSPLIALDLRYIRGGNVANCEFRGGVDHNLLIAFSDNIRITDCTFTGSNHDQNGYGIWAGSSDNIQVRGCTFREFFKGVEFSGYRIPVRNSGVFNCIFYGGGQSAGGKDLFALGQRAVSSHAIAENITAAGNRIIDTYAAAVISGPGFFINGNFMSGKANTFAQLRYAGNATVTGNVYKGRTPGEGIFRFIHLVGMDAANYITVSNNCANNVDSYFILNNVPGARATVTGNEVEFTTPGYFLYGGGINGTMQNNVIRGL